MVEEMIPHERGTKEKVFIVVYTHNPSKRCVAFLLLRREEMRSRVGLPAVPLLQESALLAARKMKVKERWQSFLSSLSMMLM